MVNSIGVSACINYGNNFDNGSYITFPSLYDTLGFTSNVFAVLNGIKVAKYLNHIHGNPPKVGWFMSNLYKVDKISQAFEYAAAIVDGINVYMDTNDLGLTGWTIVYDVSGMVIASSLGGAIGSFFGVMLGGPVGAIIGTLTGIGIGALIQYFTEDVVNLLDKSFDDFIDWISNRWGELINA